MVKRPAMSKWAVFVLFVALGCVLVSCQSDPAAAGKPAEASPVEPSVSKEIPQKSTVEIPVGTELRVRVDQTIGTETSQPGDTFQATLETPVATGERTILPRGTRFSGHVVTARPSGRLKDRGYLTVTLDSFELGGKTYAVDTSSYRRVTGDHKKRNIVAIGGGSGVGALIGGIAGGGKGAAIGAAAGAGAGTAGAAATGKKHVSIQAETILRFKLKAPVQMEG